MDWIEQTTTMWFNVAQASGRWWQSSLGQWLDSPTLGYTRQLEERVRRGFKVWLEYQQASVEYQAVMADAWMLAFSRWPEVVIALGQEGQTADSLTQQVNGWSQAADLAFTEVFHSEKYTHAQAKLANATMAWRIHQREMVELVSRSFDIPTRTEVDEAHRANYSQRQEIKALKKELAETKTQVEALAQKRK